MSGHRSILIIITEAIEQHLNESGICNWSKLNELSILIDVFNYDYSSGVARGWQSVALATPI